MQGGVPRVPKLPQTRGIHIYKSHQDLLCEDEMISTLPDIRVLTLAD